MKVLLINPPRRADSYVFPPTSLLYVAQAIRTAGHEAEIVDIPYLLERHSAHYKLSNGSLFDYLLSKDCDILGIGGVVSTYFFYDYFVPMYRRAKPHIPIVAGGSVGYPIREVWEKYAPIDYLVEGDGELPTQRLLNCLEKKDYGGIETIPGVYYLRDGRYRGTVQESLPPESLDDIPFLDYDEVDYEYYIEELTKWAWDVIPDRSLLKAKKLRFLPILTSRGCPFKCTFCFHFNHRLRINSNDYVVNHLKFLRRKYDVNCLYMLDDLFTLSHKRTIELCEAIAKADLGFYIMGSGGKPELITDKMLESMKAAGFFRFSFGIESGSQKMLDVMEKGKSTVGMNLRALNLANEKKVPGFANLVFGMPGENHETINQTKELLIEAGLTTERFFGSWATAYPGTPLFEWMQKNNLIEDVRQYLFYVGAIGSYIYNFSELPIKELQKKVFTIRQEVDMAYYWRHGQYTAYLKKFTKKKIGEILYCLDPDLRERVKKVASSVLPSRIKRTKKQSAIDVEKWIQQIAQQSDGDLSIADKPRSFAEPMTYSGPGDLFRHTT